MGQRWTHESMKEVAAEERDGLKLGLMDRLDPYLLAHEHGITVYPIDELPDDRCSEEAVAHFTVGGRSAVWSAALVPVGYERFILENTGHSVARRCASMAHEMSHHLLEHEFNDVLLSDDGCRKVDKKKEKEAKFLAGELLIPYKAALKAAFAEKTNDEVAAMFGVSVQFAQMCMKGARVHAQRALAKQARSGSRW